MLWLCAQLKLTLGLPEPVKLWKLAEQQVDWLTEPLPPPAPELLTTDLASLLGSAAFVRNMKGFQQASAVVRKRDFSSWRSLLHTLLHDAAPETRALRLCAVLLLRLVERKTLEADVAATLHAALEQALRPRRRDASPKRRDADSAPSKKRRAPPSSASPSASSSAEASSQEEDDSSQDERSGAELSASQDSSSDASSRDFGKRYVPPFHDK